MKRVFLTILLITVTLIMLAGCAPSTAATTELSEDSKTTIITTADAKADQLIKSIEAGDMDAFHKNMSEKMAASFNQKAFTDLQTIFSTKLGKVVSFKATDVSLSNNYYVVMYELACEKAPKVSMRLVLDSTEPNAISGLWFNAPELQ